MLREPPSPSSCSAGGRHTCAGSSFRARRCSRATASPWRSARWPSGPLHPGPFSAYAGCASRPSCRARPGHRPPMRRNTSLPPRAPCPPAPCPLPQVCHTGGLRQLLPAFVPSFLFGAPSALVDLAVDDARHTLYARTQASGLQVRWLARGSAGAAQRMGGGIEQNVRTRRVTLTLARPICLCQQLHLACAGRGRRRPAAPLVGVPPV